MAQIASISLGGIFSLVKSSMAISGFGVRAAARVAVVGRASAEPFGPAADDFLPEGGLAAAQTRMHSANKWPAARTTALRFRRSGEVFIAVTSALQESTGRSEAVRSLRQRVGEA
jgi:hypothetical protein